MKRRRFITFGSILAMVLSLATVSYTTWFFMRHHRGYAGMNEALTLWKSSDGVCKVYDGGTALTFTCPAIVCQKCRGTHFGFLDCKSTIARFAPMRDHTYNWGPFLYVFASGIMGLTPSRPTLQYLIIDYWVPIPILATIPALWLFAATRRRLRKNLNHCERCDYDLTGNESGVCPECGTAIPQVVHPVKENLEQ